jgi:hypothetical protein
MSSENQPVILIHIDLEEGIKLFPREKEGITDTWLSLPFRFDNNFWEELQEDLFNFEEILLYLYFPNSSGTGKIEITAYFDEIEDSSRGEKLHIFRYHFLSPPLELNEFLDHKGNPLTESKLLEMHYIPIKT